jgi:hypothetical protein
MDEAVMMRQPLEGQAVVRHPGAPCPTERSHVVVACSGEPRGQLAGLLRRPDEHDLVAGRDAFRRQERANVVVAEPDQPLGRQ